MKSFICVPLAVLFFVAVPALARAEPLTLSDVLISVDLNHPSLDEAEQMVLAAEGDSLSTEGAFDPKLKLSGKGQPLGKYTKGQLEAMVTQVTPWWGVSFFAGWRRGFGSFALYDGNLETLSAGEFSTGFELPLWRGGPIDDMRARMQQADLDVVSAKERRELVALLLENAAARAYWNWVEAGQKVRIVRELLEVATTRVAGLNRRIEKGDAAPILGVDNQRIVLDRRAQLIAARRKLQQSAIKLSLYLRDDLGEPVRVGEDRLPSTLPDAKMFPTAALVRDIRHGRDHRPDLALLLLAQSRQEVEVAFRDNDVSPTINLQGWLAKDFGGGKEELRPLDLGVGISVEIPLLLRKERGKLGAARAKLAAVKQKTRLGRDKVEAEIRIAFAAVEAAARTVNLLRAQRLAAERMASAERRKLALGETDLLTVNLRELSVASASSKEVSARADFQRALVDYRTASARSPQ